jgi:bifunctional polynucleotide phosphatase/kinase
MDPKSMKIQQKHLEAFKTRVEIVLGQLDLPLNIYAATERDKYRKPRVGMWTEMLEDYDLDFDESVDLAGSFLVGDAAGRPGDFACSDR